MSLAKRDVAPRAIVSNSTPLVISIIEGERPPRRLATLEIEPDAGIVNADADEASASATREVFIFSEGVRCPKGWGPAHTLKPRSLRLGHAQGARLICLECATHREMSLTLCLVAALSAFSASPPAAARRVLLYVDPKEPSEGAEAQAVFAAVEARGGRCIQLWSEAMADALCKGTAPDFVAQVRALEAPPPGRETTWADEHGISGCVAGVLCGSDGGLATAERLLHVLCPQHTNGLCAARRDKFSMVEACKAAGLRTAAQSSPLSWAEAAGFIGELLRAPGGEMRAVLKPRRGQASVMVGLARSLAEAEEMYRALEGAPVSLEQSEQAGESRVVVQEFLEGEEWVVDTVSCDGEHKALALWRYDRGAANGASFVSFCDEPRPAESDAEHEMIRYAFGALDALGWRYGPAHIELKRTHQDGSALVEVNAGRFNGVDFKLIADLCFGHNAYEAAVDCFLCAEAFGEVPTTPASALRCEARLVKLVASVSGDLLEIGHQEQLESLGERSLVRFEPEPSEPGEPVRRTIDLDSCAGYAYLLHGDREVVQQDYETLRALQPTLFHVSTGEQHDDKRGAEQSDEERSRAYNNPGYRRWLENVIAPGRSAADE